MNHDHKIEGCECDFCTGAAAERVAGLMATSIVNGVMTVEDGVVASINSFILTIDEPGDAAIAINVMVEQIANLIKGIAGDDKESTETLIKVTCDALDTHATSSQPAAGELRELLTTVCSQNQAFRAQHERETTNATLQ